MKPEAPRPETIMASDENKCKKCGNENIDELKPAKKGKGMFCVDVVACKQRTIAK
jgi:lysyl-tRNA synthetase class 2